MIRMVRILGVMLMIVGGLVILTWFIKPLRQIWPQLIQAFQTLPIAIQIGLVIAVVGFLLLFGSLVWERIEDRAKEQDLLKED